jgi:hypothetical protein
MQGNWLAGMFAPPHMQQAAQMMADDEAKRERHLKIFGVPEPAPSTLDEESFRNLVWAIATVTTGRDYTDPNAVTPRVFVEELLDRERFKPNDLWWAFRSVPQMSLISPQAWRSQHEQEWLHAYENYALEA